MNKMYVFVIIILSVNIVLAISILNFHSTLGWGVALINYLGLSHFARKQLENIKREK